MRFPSLHLLALLAAAFSIPLRLIAAETEAPAPPTKWEKEIAAFEEKDRANPPAKGAIVFVGSSSIRLWTTLEKDFPHHRVLNRGFGGSLLSDSVYFADRIVIPYVPRLVVVYAGGNDINVGKSAEEVAADFRALVKKVRASLPEVPIAYISIAGNPQRWAQVETVKTANRLIADEVSKDPKLTFIDVFPAMLGADGLPLPDIFVADHLHMNPKGYEIWKGIVGKYLPAPDQ